jgi:hypothetical protein
VGESKANGYNTSVVSAIDAETRGSQESCSERAGEVVQSAHEITGRLRRAK